MQSSGAIARVAFWVMAAVTTVWLVGSADVASAGDPPASDDPFLWLEDVDGARAMAWVRAENAKTAAVLESDPRYEAFFKEALALAQAKDRIPQPRFLAGAIFNHWQDADHVRGIWRRTSVDEYRKSTPAWTTVMDLDAIAAEEKANWFRAGADCEEPSQRRCMIALSDGGEDAVTYREFDVGDARFVERGFALPRGKQWLAWQDSKTLLVGREWTAGEMTRSGYPFVVKRLRRGQSLSAAVEVFRGTPDDVYVAPLSLHDGEGRLALLIVRALSFYDFEYRLIGPRTTARLALPAKSDVLGLVAGRLIIRLREPWASAEGEVLPSGSLAAVDLAAARRAPDKLRPAIVYVPGPRDAFVEAGFTRKHLLVTVLENVKGRAYVYTPEARGRWSRRTLALPSNASIHVVDADLHGDRVFLNVTGFLTPNALWLADLQSGESSVVKALPARFDASRSVVEQFEGTSADGTRVPYFLVRPVDMKHDATTPTILQAYGGFLSVETPYYSGETGKLWLERGGAFVVANIRGGGEFGPGWHAAGLKTQRQRIFDDFHAVAKDLVERRVTSPSRLGLMGGSNGGLLMGVAMNQHPELFGAVDMQIPLLDMLRYEHIAAGSSWVGEYGSVANPEERAFLASISPYHNLKPDVRYPEPLIWTTTKDDRVGPQHARKYAARLSAMGLPYLFYEVVQGGHGAGATLEEKAAMKAREFTYFARKLGLS